MSCLSDVSRSVAQKPFVAGVARAHPGSFVHATASCVRLAIHNSTRGAETFHHNHHNHRLPAQEPFHLVGGVGAHDGQFGLLIAREVSQYEGSWVHAAGWSADAKGEASIIAGAERFGD